MKTLLNRKTIIIAAIAVLIAISTIVSINVWGTVGPVTSTVNTISKPLRALASVITGPFENIYDSIYRYDDLMVDYERALLRMNELEQAYRDYIAITEENTRLRELLGFAERHGGYEHVDAFADTRSSSNWSSSFSIDLGHANSNIARGNAVVSEFGMLIGQISEVGATNSTVITILDTSFSAGVYIGDSSGRATARGDFTLMRNGLLMLDYFDTDLIIRPGDSVVTSGIGGVLPSGLFIGEVVEVLRHDTGIGRYATVRPMRDVMTIEHVFVITGFETAE